MVIKTNPGHRDFAHTRPTNRVEAQGHFSSYPSVLLAIVFISMLALSSCVDLIEITQLAKSSQEVGNSFTQIADEAASSCKRANTFIPAGQQALSCEAYTKTEPSLIKVNDALFAYIASLGKLAAADTAKKDELVNISSDLQQADKNISQQNLDRAKAAGGLADVITHVVLSRYQQHELAKIIGNQNASVKAVAEFLSGYAADKCEAALKEEKLLEANYFQDQLEKYGAQEPLAVYLLKLKHSDNEQSTDAKIQAVEKYKQAVSSMATAHQKLFDQRNKWNTQQLITDLAPEIQQLSEAATSMTKAFQ